MGYKSIFITKECKIHIKNNNLMITQNKKDNSISLDSIASIVIETQKATLTTYTISKLAEFGVVVLYVDSKYSLNAITIPFHKHSLFSKIVHNQIKIKNTLKRKLWREIIKSKIFNQAEVLKYFDKRDTAKRLSGLSKIVKLDDSDNIEAKSAKLYWSELFDKFIRIQKGAEDIKNSSLNYTYAILRSAIIRSITNAGLMPSFGIHHQNYYNSFNLADDLIEPFRAFADLHVKSILDIHNNKELNPFLKSKFINILNLECIDMDDKLSSLRVAIDITCSSFQKCILEDNLSWLILPKINFEKYECL